MKVQQYTMPASVHTQSAMQSRKAVDGLPALLCRRRIDENTTLDCLSLGAFGLPYAKRLFQATKRAWLGAESILIGPVFSLQLNFKLLLQSTPFSYSSAFDLVYIGLAMPKFIPPFQTTIAIFSLPFLNLFCTSSTTSSLPKFTL